VPRSGDRRRLIGTCAAALVAGATALLAQTAPARTPPVPTPAAQTPPDAPTPRFRTETDVVVVEATVLDRKGVVVKGLGAADFKVEIGGKPREIVSAELVQYSPPSTDAETAASDPEITTNEPKENGRVILLVIDQGGLGSDTKSVMDSARFWEFFWAGSFSIAPLKQCVPRRRRLPARCRAIPSNRGAKSVRSAPSF